MNNKQFATHPKNLGEVDMGEFSVRCEIIVIEFIAVSFKNIFKKGEG